MIFAMVFVRDLGFPVLRVKLAVLRCSADLRSAIGGRKRGLPDGAKWPPRPKVFAQVGEWLKPTDCKSVPPSEVRRFESFPVHQS